TCGTLCPHRVGGCCLRTVRNFLRSPWVPLTLRLQLFRQSADQSRRPYRRILLSCGTPCPHRVGGCCLRTVRNFLRSPWVPLTLRLQLFRQSADQSRRPYRRILLSSLVINQKL
ncbi:hypothetical protein C0J52_25482, partial [Blattella germanica]